MFRLKIYLSFMFNEIGSKVWVGNCSYVVEGLRGLEKKEYI